MKRCLVDVNVVLPLLVAHHAHHVVAVKWYENLRAGEAGICRVAQLALLRLLSNRSVMGEHVLSSSRAWRVIAELLEDERIDLEPETSGIESVFPELLTYRVPTPNLVMDAYLAAFSIAADMRLTTLDKAFAQFSRADIEMLGA